MASSRKAYLNHDIIKVILVKPFLEEVKSQGGGFSGVESVQSSAPVKIAPGLICLPSAPIHSILDIQAVFIFCGFS